MLSLDDVIRIAEFKQCYGELSPSFYDKDAREFIGPAASQSGNFARANEGEQPSPGTALVTVEYDEQSRTFRHIRP